MAPLAGPLAQAAKTQATKQDLVVRPLRIFSITIKQANSTTLVKIKEWTSAVGLVIQERMMKGDRLYMYCRSCGKSIPDESRFCLHCGTCIPEQSTDELSSITATHSQQTGVRCPRCGQMDFVQKVESVAYGGTAKLQSPSGSGQSTPELARYFALPDMPKDRSLYDNKMILPDLKDRVEWLKKRYRRSLLYFCHRDHIVFIPGQDMMIEPSEVQSYLKDSKSHAQLVRHLQKNGWQLVKTELKPAPGFEWLFLKISGRWL